MIITATKSLFNVVPVVVSLSLKTVSLFPTYCKLQKLHSKIQDTPARKVVVDRQFTTWCI